MPQSDRLQDKVILVVGGTTGLGLSAARAMVGAGARVAVLGRNPDHAQDAAKALGPSGLAVNGDATTPGTIEDAIARTQAKWERLDGLYHVAGGSGRRLGDGPLHEITDEGWDRTLQWNLTSVFLSNRAVLRHFLEHQQAGSILNMTSVLGFSPSPAHFSTHAYATAKAAIIGLTRSSAAHYAPRNIRINALAPALVATPMSERAQGDDAIMDFIRHKQPLDRGRIGQPEDLDGAAVFFMSDEARFVTGQVLAVDGGWSVTDGGGRGD